MSEIKSLYKNWIREEIQSPEVKSAKEAFFQNRFPKPQAGPSRWAFAMSPSFRLAIAGCFALVILVKVGAFETVVPPTPQSQIPASDEQSFTQAVTSQKSIAPLQMTPAYESNIRIKKLSSQMGATVTYQKHFSDAQITVLWVLPQGV